MTPAIGTLEVSSLPGKPLTTADVPFLITVKSNLTILVPAYNEAKSIRDTIVSLLKQTVQADEIVVIDDFSSDGTGDIARAMGVTVLRPVRNTGSKAGAQNYALQFVNTKYTMAIDADTTLAPDAVEKLLAALKDERVAAACGFVLPRYVHSVWERGRYIEYLLAFTFYKQIQEYYEKPLISSGCFSIYRTSALKFNGGWPTRTLAEDMDLTWSFYEQRLKVRFVQDAVCYPIEPHNFEFMRKQLKRWSHGFVQNVLLHWPKLLKFPYLRSIIAVALWDAVVASIAYLLLLPVLAIVFRSPWFFLGYVIDLPAVLMPILYKSVERRELIRTVLSIPAFFVLRTTNAFFMLEALISECIFKKKFCVYEKGH